jgi:Metallo-peptidase family M12B Reprolysin-like/Secretion system C-terminal sorting domain
MKKKFTLTALFAVSVFCGFSQTDRFWDANTSNQTGLITDKAVLRLSFPKEFKLFNLNTDALRQQLFTASGFKGKHSAIISLPNIAGAIEQFEVFEASNFEPELQAKFPEIRSYSGKGITDKYASLKLSISPQGIQTMVFRTGKDNEFIEPYSKDHSVYAVFKSQREKGKLAWSCSTEEQQLDADVRKQITPASLTGSSTGQLKTMRLAQSCNGEYANYFGATSASQVALVLAAFNATLTRCNGVYEKDLALHLNLIANTTSVIYYTPSTDPYTTLSNWNIQLQRTLTSVIGSANYDIGHMFGASGGGGNAGCIGCVCVNPANNNSKAKGSGITSPADGIPQGDNFDIDYVVHEVGHQLGANHTFSMSLEGTGVNKEIGSGITIMGYAGITSYDVAPHSIDIFHETSIAQIQSNLATKTCPVSVTMTANHAPVVAAVNNYTIPISTPFALTAAATDAESDALTYCWEQNDNSTTSGSGSIASPTKTSGPNWLSFSPTASGTRTFPKLSTVLSGLNVTPVLPGGDAGVNIEALSSVARTLNFRVTVRDNHPYVLGAEIGQTAFTDAVVTVSAASGPFAVTAPNTAITWNEGATQTVTWNVNGTTAAPVSCAAVNILLSVDGGFTFPTVLAANTANDGTENIIVPAGTSSTCRIKVEAVGNIFFDISNANFTIASPLFVAAPVAETSEKLMVSPNPASYSADISFKSDISGVAVVTMLNQNGTVISSKIINITKGLNSSKLEIGKLSTGWYTVKVQHGSNVLMSKIIINK